MRGEDQPTEHFPGTVGRFTPTCVGKTKAIEGLSGSLDGSPPHAWGRPAPGIERPSHYPVHPHMRGEDHQFVPA